MTNNRDTVTIIVNHTTNYVHFCSTKLAKGWNDTDDFWFPIITPAHLFEVVEGIMVTGNVAHNVTSIEKLRSCGDCVDYKVTYNKPIADKVTS